MLQYETAAVITMNESDAYESPSAQESPASGILYGARHIRIQERE